MEAKHSISELKGVGPKSQAMLARAGITTVEQLRKLGAVEAYVRTKRVNTGVSLNMLWGLESVMTGEHWRDVAKNHRTSLLLALEEREKNV
jgi:DNA transformation protein